MTRPSLLLFLMATLGSTVPEHVVAQALRSVIEEPSRLSAGPEVNKAALAVPDSVRQKVGYQHWKGGIIGTAAGATVGLLLGLAAGPCDDCSSPEPRALETSALVAGIGGAFGFLVGAASPKYRWVSRPAEEESRIPEP
jgi:hypothetical protein